MPHHDWLDADFDFDGLDEVMGWMHTAYRRLTGQHMMMKEKYGTTRYEFHCTWCNTEKEMMTWLAVVKRATVKFPDYAGEIVDDIVPLLEDGYYKGYFEAILWLKHKDKWETCK